MTITALVTTVLVIILGIYDLVCVVIGRIRGKDVTYTVSHFLAKTGFDVPMVVFAIGFICGHLFGYMQPPKDICSGTKIERIGPPLHILNSGGGDE